MSFEVDRYREDFPALKQEIHRKPLVYFDNAATTLKPIPVVEAVKRHYLVEAASIHRGVHYLSQEATLKFENARSVIQHFINARHAHEIIFTAGTTDSINLVAHSFGEKYIKPGDEIILSGMEHHANIVPWQILRDKTGAILKVIPVDDNGDLMIDEYKKLLSDKTKIVGLVHVSNALGTINPIKEMIKMAHDVGAKVLIDGAQSIAHSPVNVADLDCDFFAFSGHKIYGPTGIGVLYGKKELLGEMPPYRGGGAMIESVTFDESTYNVLPHKFEAGTPHIAGVIGLAEAINYVQEIGLKAIAKYETEIHQYLEEKIHELDGVRIIGTPKQKSAITSLVMTDVHPHDIGTFADQEGVAIRTGHHCCQPIMQRFGVPATARVSLSFYNKKEEIDILVESLKSTQEFFK